MSCLYTYNRPVDGTCFIQGDTIPAFQIQFDAGQGIDLTTADIRMQVYWNDTKYIDVSSFYNGGVRAENGLTIINSTTFSVLSRAYTEEILPVGIGYGDIEFTIDGVRTTLFAIEYNISKHRTI